MDTKIKSGLETIAAMHDGAEYKSVTKADLFEAVKRARHIAKLLLDDDAENRRLDQANEEARAELRNVRAVLPVDPDAHPMSGRVGEY